MKNIVLWLSWNVSGKWLEDYEFEFENFNVYDFLREGTNSYRIQVKNRTDITDTGENVQKWTRVFSTRR